MPRSFADSAAAAVDCIKDGDTVLIGGFGKAGQPVELIEALLDRDVTDLVVVNNNAGNGDVGLASLIAAGKVAKMICSFPRQSDSHHFDEAFRAGRIQLELVPQGTLAERIRAGGAGIGGFFTPTGFGTPLAEGKETPASSTVAGTCWRPPSPVTSPSSRHTAPTAPATSSTARPPATSAPSWPPPPHRPLSRSSRSYRSAGSTRRSW